MLQMWEDQVFRDCPRHPYKSRVYALGLAEDTDILEDIPEHTDELSEEQIKTGTQDQDMVLDNDDEQYVDDLYNGELCLRHCCRAMHRMVTTLQGST